MRANARFIAASRDLVPALLAERDAALAEVARLSTPPDDAEVADLVAELGEPLVIIEGYSTDYVDTDDVRERMGKAADALTRLSHALASETAKREAMEQALTEIDALDPEHLIDSCAHTAMRGLVLRMGEVARATLAKHGSK